MDSLLAHLRKDRKLKRATVARHLGLDETTVYLWEVGKRRPNGENLIALAQLYEVEPSTIMDAIKGQRSEDTVDLSND